MCPWPYSPWPSTSVWAETSSLDKDEVKDKDKDKGNDNDKDIDRDKGKGKHKDGEVAREDMGAMGKPRFSTQKKNLKVILPILIEFREISTGTHGQENV